MIDAGGVGLLGVNLAATCAMVGLIWFVQVAVSYTHLTLPTNREV